MSVSRKRATKEYEDAVVRLEAAERELRAAYLMVLRRSRRAVRGGRRQLVGRELLPADQLGARPRAPRAHRAPARLHRAQLDQHRTGIGVVELLRALARHA